MSSPAELERAFLAVVETFSGIEDQKTGKKLFGPKAWNLVKKTLHHIRSGCLSDVPGMFYYCERGVDACGIPIMHCIRGTSALEGFHQHIRQLIRGCALSPRLANSLIAVFVHRWNHNLDVKIRGLSDLYDCFCAGWIIEEQRRGMEKWGLKDLPFSGISSTCAFGSTGEVFGVEISVPTTDLEEPPGDDDDLEQEAEEIANDIATSETENLFHPDTQQGTFGERLTPSALQMCSR